MSPGPIREFPAVDKMFSGGSVDQSPPTEQGELSFEAGLMWAMHSFNHDPSHERMQVVRDTVLEAVNHRVHIGGENDHYGIKTYLDDSDVTKGYRVPALPTLEGEPPQVTGVIIGFQHLYKQTPGNEEQLVPYMIFEVDGAPHFFNLKGVFYVEVKTSDVVREARPTYLGRPMPNEDEQAIARAGGVSKLRQLKGPAGFIARRIIGIA